MDKLYTGFVDFLTGDFEYSSELQSFWMAFQGVMIVRNGVNHDRHMNWFHAFLLSIMCGYGGAVFGFIWMGKPSSMLSNDLNFGSCILCFLFVNYLPFDLGYNLGNFLPVVLVTTSFSQLFRSSGLMKFVGVAFEDLKQSPSRYYPIPVFGPILYGTLLGNMSGFFLKGFHGYLADGMPWPFQNGLVCATLYHFYVNDTTGPIGNALRDFVHTYLHTLQGGLDDRTFATAAVSLFMQIVGILHMPIFLGPNFSPFTLMGAIVRRITQLTVSTVVKPRSKVVGTVTTATKEVKVTSNTAPKQTKSNKKGGGKTDSQNGNNSTTTAVKEIKVAVTKQTKDGQDVGQQQNGTAAMSVAKSDTAAPRRKRPKKKIS